MILWLASLSYFAVTLVLAHRLGASRARFWLLAIAPLIGAMIGLGIAVPIGNPGSTPFDLLMFGSLPAIGALVMHSFIGAMLFAKAWLVPLLPYQPPGKQHLRFSSDATMADALDVLEDQVRVKYIPCGPIASEEVLAYEAWIEVLEEARGFASFLIVPALARLRLIDGDDMNLKQTEPLNCAVAVLLVPAYSTGRVPVAIAASNAKFCNRVMQALESVPEASGVR